MDKINFIQKLQISNQVNTIGKKSHSFLSDIPYDSVEIHTQKKQKGIFKVINSVVSFFKNLKKKPQIPFDSVSNLSERQKQLQLLKMPSLPSLNLSDKEVEELLADLDDSQMSKFIELYSKKIWFVEHLASIEAKAQNANLEKLSQKDKDKIRINSLKEFITTFYDEKKPDLFNRAMDSVYSYNETIAKTQEMFSTENKVKLDTQNSPQMAIPKDKASAAASAKAAAKTIKTASKEDIEPIKAKISESLYLYKPLEDNSENYWQFYRYCNDLNSKSTDDYIKMFEKAIKASNQELSQDDLASICQSFIFDKKTIENLDFKDVSFEAANRVKQKLCHISDVFSQLSSFIETTPKLDNETTSEYLKRINDKYLKSLMEKQSEKEAALQSCLRFFENTKGIQNAEKIELSLEEKQRLVDIINSWSKGTDKVTIDTPMSDLAFRWKKKYISGGVYGMDSKLQDACIQEFKRYSSIDDKFIKTLNQPVYRWMDVQEGMDEFLKKMPKEGGIYCPKKLQSCSKTRLGAETCFHDNNPSMNVKFVIYPKSQVSKAYDIGEGKYGPFEVIYPSDSQFRVLYKNIEEIKHDEKLLVPAMENNTKTGSHMQAVVYLQEV